MSTSVNRGFESTAISSTSHHLGFLLGGLVAGEGSFVVTRRLPPFADGQERLRFKLCLEMARRDRPLLEQLRAFLGRGSIHDIPARRRNWQPTSAFTIASFVGHHTATIPFAERYLLDSAKRRQFEHWKEAMHLYETTNAGRIRRGRSSGSEPGCEGAVRGRGLCRSHYYRATGY